MIARGVTTAAVVVAAATGAGALAVLSGMLTLFGWGIAVAVALLAVTVAGALRPRPANAWLLVPLLALAIPAVAVAVSGVRVLPQRGPVAKAPATADSVPQDGYRVGTGDLLVDLRNLRADPGEHVTVRAGSDLGRTVVALPQDRCFALDVRWKTGDLRLPRLREQPTVVGISPKVDLKNLGQQGPRLRRRHGLGAGRIALFGRVHDDAHGRWVAATEQADAPSLTLELESDGGSFVVRDYPTDVAPLRATEWPIDQVPPRYPKGPRSHQALWMRMEAQRRAIEETIAERARSATTPATPARPTPATSTTRPSTTTTATPRLATPARPTPATSTTRPSTTTTSPPRLATPERPTPNTTRTRPAPTTTPIPAGAAALAPAPDAPVPTRTTRGGDWTTSAPTPQPRRVEPLADQLQRQRRLLALSQRQADEWRQAGKRRHAYARRWAARVAGSCNPRGEFR